MEFIQFRGVWHVRFYDATGNRRMRSLKAQVKEGQSAPDKYIRSLASQVFKETMKEPERPKPADLLFGATVADVVAAHERHLERLQEARRRRGTSRNKFHAVVYQLWHWKALGKYRLFEVDEGVLDGHEKARLKTGITDSTMNREKQIFRAALRRAALSKVDREQAERIIKLFRFESEERFIRNRNPKTEDLKTLVRNTRIHAAVALLLQAVAGCRHGEVLRVRWDDVRWSLRALHLGVTKNGSTRWAPLAIKRPDGSVDMELLKILAVYRARQRDKKQECDFIVSWRRKQIASYKHAFRSARDQTEASDIRPHDFRHMANTRLLRYGYGKEVRMQAMGHKTSEANDRYFDGAEIAEITGVAAPEIPGTVSCAEFVEWFGLEKYANAANFFEADGADHGIRNGIQRDTIKNGLQIAL